MIELRSDTFTLPTEGMRDAMFSAPLGDDVFGEDPTVNHLQKKVAELFGMENALFCNATNPHRQEKSTYHHEVCFVRRGGGV